MLLMQFYYDGNDPVRSWVSSLESVAHCWM